MDDGFRRFLKEQIMVYDRLLSNAKEGGLLQLEYRAIRDTYERVLKVFDEESSKGESNG